MIKLAGKYLNERQTKVVLLILLFLALIGLLLIFFTVFNPFDILTPSQSSSRDFQKDAAFIADQCRPENYREECYSNQLGELTRKTDMPHAIQTLLALQDIDPQQSRGCHLMAHYISTAEAQNAPEKWQELIKKQDSSMCSGGFIHGILEVHLSSDPDFVLDGSKFETICSLVNRESRRSCYHNLGHLLLVEESNNIPNTVKNCSRIEADLPKYECLSGMFMENITRLNLVAHGLGEKIPWDKANTEKVENLCSQYSGLAAKACWKEISYMYASINRNEPSGLYKSCYSISNKEWADECYIYGIGNMVNFATFKQSNLNRACTVYDSKNPLYERCLFQIVSTMTSSSPKFSPQAIKLCSESPPQLRNSCFERIGRNLKKAGVSLEDRHGYCLDVTMDNHRLCIGE